MKDGFIRVAAATPLISVADCTNNADQIIALMREADEKKAKLVVFPELCLTGYTCGELFLQNVLLEEARHELARIARR